MTKQEIIKAGKESKKEGIVLYYSYASKNGSLEEKIISNFDDSPISDNRLIKLQEQGVLVQDWDTLYVKSSLPEGF